MASPHFTSLFSSLHPFLFPVSPPLFYPSFFSFPFLTFPFFPLLPIFHLHLASFDFLSFSYFSLPFLFYFCYPLIACFPSFAFFSLFLICSLPLVSFPHLFYFPPLLFPSIMSHSLPFPFSHFSSPPSTAFLFIYFLSIHFLPSPVNRDNFPHIIYHLFFPLLMSFLAASRNQDTTSAFL